MAATSVVQLVRHSNALAEPFEVVTSGLDFRLVVWGPVRGLIGGFNPYGYPADPGYTNLTGAALPSGLRPPSMLAFEGLLGLLPFEAAYIVSVLLNSVLLWAAILVTARPARLRGQFSTLALGSTVVLGGPADFLLGLGQVAALAALGLALVVRYPSSWVGALGLAMVLTTPPMGIATSFFLLALGYSRLVAKGWALTALLSLPFVTWAVVNEGDLIDFITGAFGSLAYSASDSNAENRIDIGGPWLGLGSAAPIVSIGCLLLMWIILRRYRPELDEITLLAVISVTSVTLYHMPYHSTVWLALGIAAVVAPRSPALVRVPMLFALLASALSSFTLFWTQRFEEGSVWFALQPMTRATLALMPVILSVTATLEAVRRSRHQQPDPQQ